MPAYTNRRIKKWPGLAIIFLALHWNLTAQTTLHLNDLYRALEQYHPYHRLDEAVKSVELQQKKINALGTWPQTSFQGQATWQSDVTEIPLTIPGLDIPGQAHDQYRAVVEISQSLYDGGARKALNEQASRATAIEAANAEVQFIGLKETVCRTYYNALMADLAIKQLELLSRDLDQKAVKLNNQIREGMVSGYQEASLQLKIKENIQNILDAKKQKSNALKSLEWLTGIKLDSSVQLTYQVLFPEDQSARRPELAVLDAQRKMYAAQFQLSNTKFQPRVQAFGQLGYGRPGLNLLSDDFEPYSILGLRWQWNLGNLYTRQSTREKNILQANLDKVNIQEEAFVLQQKIREQAQLLDIENLNQLIKEDQAMIALHERVVKSSEAQFENGIITVNEYATDTFNLTQARLKTDIHLALLSQSKELLKLIHGND